MLVLTVPFESIFGRVHSPLRLSFRLRIILSHGSPFSGFNTHSSKFSVLQPGKYRQTDLEMVRDERKRSNLVTLAVDDKLLTSIDQTTKHIVPGLPAQSFLETSPRGTQFQLRTLIVEHISGSLCVDTG